MKDSGLSHFSDAAKEGCVFLKLRGMILNKFETVPMKLSRVMVMFIISLLLKFFQRAFFKVVEIFFLSLGSFRSAFSRYGLSLFIFFPLPSFLLYFSFTVSFLVVVKFRVIIGYLCDLKQQIFNGKFKMADDLRFSGPLWFILALFSFR